jgi:eukaryotic-like serine/threonine-protein kinase
VEPKTIAGRYDVESRIGSGGMGTVWRGSDRVLQRPVAIKLLHEGLAADASFAERFRREALAAAKLSHPNIAAVYDSGDANGGGVPFIVMEYVEGESLSTILKEQGPLPVEDTVRIGRSVLGALAHAHARGLVHRDMKPGNVLCDANTGDAKVVDFGIAKGMEDTGGLTRTSGLIGTAAYLSPEQVSGKSATPVSDVYAVGCLLYACLTGEPPFGGDTAVAVAMKHLQEPVPPLRSRRPDVPPDLEAVVMRALAKDPAQRFSSALSMDSALAKTGLDRRAASAPTVVTPRPDVAAPVRTHTEVMQRAPSKNPSARFLAALAAFLITAAIAALIVLYLQNREPTQSLNGQVPAPSFAGGSQGTSETPQPTSSPTPSPAASATSNETPKPTSPFGNLPVLGD